MKAIRRFKAILERHRAARSDSPKKADDDFDPIKARERAEEIEALVSQRRQYFEQQRSRSDMIRQLTLDLDRPVNAPDEDVTDREPLFLGVGAGDDETRHSAASPEHPQASAVSESPTNADFNVYDKAYEAEVERIMANPARKPTMYLTRLVQEKRRFNTVPHVVEGTEGHPADAGSGKAMSLADLVSRSMSKAAITGGGDDGGNDGGNGEGDAGEGEAR